jgi:hypothetical protein
MGVGREITRHDFIHSMDLATPSLPWQATGTAAADNPLAWCVNPLSFGS